MDRVSTRGDRTLVAEGRGVMVVSSARAVESIAIRDDGASMAVNKKSRGVEAQKSCHQSRIESGQGQVGGGKREQRVVMASSRKGIEECFGTNEIPRRRWREKVTESGPKRDVEREKTLVR